MTQSQRYRLCSSRALVNSGSGVKFQIRDQRRVLPAFAIRYEDQCYAYINQCAHQQVNLDWQSGHFFNVTKTALICAVHGALYDPASGHCLGGPCAGGRLRRLTIEEENGAIYVVLADSMTFLEGGASA